MQKYKKISTFAYKLKVNIQQRFYFVIFLPHINTSSLINTSSPYEGFYPPGTGGVKTIKGWEEFKTIEG